MDSKKLVESKNMFSVVQEMDAGYNKFFDSKPKTSTIRSECYKNYRTCGTSSGDVQKRCAENENDKINSDNNSASELHSKHQSLVQEFFPPPKLDEKKQPISNKESDEKKQPITNSGCRKYQCMKLGQ